MAIENVDALLIETQFGDSGLTRQVDAEIQEIRRFTAAIELASTSTPPIEVKTDTGDLERAKRLITEFTGRLRGENLPPINFNLDKVIADLQRGGGDINAFFASFRAGAAEAVAEGRTLDDLFNRLAIAAHTAAERTAASTAAVGAGATAPTEAVRGMVALTEAERGVVGATEAATVAVKAQAQGTQAAAVSAVALAESTLRAAEAFRHAGVSEEDLNRTLERSHLLSVQAAESTLLAARAAEKLAASSAAAAVAPSAGGPTFAGSIRSTETLIDRLGVATRGGAALNEVLNTPPRGPSGIREIIGQLEFLPAAAEASAAAQRTVGQSFAVASAQVATYSAEIRQAIEIQGQFALAGRQAAESLTLQERAARAAVAASAAAGAAGAGPGASAALGNVAASNLLAAAQSEVTSQTSKMTAGLAAAARQYAVLTAAEEAAATGSGRVIAGMTEAGLAARAEAASLEVASAGIGRLNTAHRSVLEHGRAGAQALHTVATAATVLGAEALGAQGPVLRLAEGLILFSGGIGGILAAGVALAGIGLIFEHLTEDARKQKKETDDAIASLLKLQEAQRNPVAVRLAETGQAGRQIDELKGKIQALSEEQRRLRAVPIELQNIRGAPSVSAALTDVTDKIAKLEEELTKLGGAVKAGSLDLAAQQAGQLAQALRLGVAGATGLAEAAQTIRNLNAEIAAGAGDREHLNQLQARANDLTNAALDPIQRELEALRGIREAVAQTGGARIGFETAAAGRQLDELQKQLDQINKTVTTQTKPLAFRVQVLIDQERLQQDIAPIQLKTTLDQASATAALAEFQRLQQQAAQLGAPARIRLDVADARDALNAFGSAIAADLEAIANLSPAAQRALAGITQQFRALQQQLRDRIAVAPLTQLVDSIGPLAQRLEALRVLFAGTGQEQANTAGTAALLTSAYIKLTAEIARVGGVAGADTRLLEAEARALRAMGEGTQPLVAALAVAATGLHEAETRARLLSEAVNVVPTKGLLVPGNIDLLTRPIVRNLDQTISTLRSLSFEADGREILIPTVSAQGILSTEEAINQFRQTGQHLGQFMGAEAATAFALQLHQQQAQLFLPAVDRLREQLEASVKEAEQRLRQGNLGTGTPEDQRVIKRILELDVETARTALSRFDAPGVIVRALTVDPTHAAETLRQFQADVAENAVIQAKLELDVRTAADALRQFRTEGDTPHKLLLTANLERAQDALGQFLSQTAEARAVITVDADITGAQAAVKGLFAQLEARQAQRSFLQIDKESQRTLDQVDSSVGNIGQKLGEAAAKSDSLFGRFVRQAGDSRTAGERLADSVHDVTRGLDGIVGSARNIGLIGDAAAAAIGSVLDLADALGEVAKSASAGNIAGLVAAGINIVGSILGPNDTERERNRLLAEGNALLRQRNAELAVREGGVAGVSQLQHTLATLLSSGDLLARIQQGAIAPATEGRRTLVDVSGLQRDDLRRILADAGTDITAFAAQIKQVTGLDVLDKKGNLVAAAFDLAKQAIDQMIKEATTFANTFAEQSRAIELEARLRGESTDAVARFSREVEAAGQFSPAVKAAFQGVDTGNADAVRKAALGLFEQFKLGTLTAAELGNLTKDQFIQFLEDAAGAAEALAGATNAATQSMINIPKGFKQAELAFQAQIPGLGPNAPEVPPPPRVRQIDSNLFPLPGGTDGAALPQLLAVLAKQRPSQQFSGPITIQVSGVNKDGLQIARQIREDLRTGASADVQSTDGWGTV